MMKPLSSQDHWISWRRDKNTPQGPGSKWRGGQLAKPDNTGKATSGTQWSRKVRVVSNRATKPGSIFVHPSPNWIVLEAPFLFHLRQAMAWARSLPKCSAAKETPEIPWRHLGQATVAMARSFCLTGAAIRARAPQKASFLLIRALEV